jgi:3-methyladenine DNA glycosylase AlkD
VSAERSSGTDAVEASAEADVIAARLRSLSAAPVDPAPIIRTALPFYGVGLRDMERIARRWLRDHPGARPREVLTLADELWGRAIREEMVTATFLVGRHRGALSGFGARRVEGWGRLLDNWETTDNLGGRVLGPWIWGDPEARISTLERLAGRRNPHLRRLALVGCVCLGRLEDSDRWWPRTAAIVLRLREDREASIPKAISWVLREHLRHSGGRVAEFLDAHGDEIPAIARRETRTKMATGTKTGRSQRTTR